MTKFYLDTEFYEDGTTIDLISIGIVCEDGRHYYAQSCEFNHRRVSDWVREHVFFHLDLCPYIITGGSFHIREHFGFSKSVVGEELRTHRTGQCQPVMNEPERHRCPWRTRRQLRHEVEWFLNSGESAPELYGWCSSYDFIVLCQLFGTMMDLPTGWPHYVKDLQQVLDERCIADEDLPPQEDGLHNALSDARHLKKLWGYITNNDAWQ